MFPIIEYGDVYLGQVEHTEIRAGEEQRSYHAQLRDLFPTIRANEGDNYLHNRELNRSREFKLDPRFSSCNGTFDSLDEGDGS